LPIVVACHHDVAVRCHEFGKEHVADARGRRCHARTRSAAHLPSRTCASRTENILVALLKFGERFPVLIESQRFVGCPRPSRESWPRMMKSEKQILGHPLGGQSPARIPDLRAQRAARAEFSIRTAGIVELDAGDTDGIRTHLLRIGESPARRLRRRGQRMAKIMRANFHANQSIVTAPAMAGYMLTLVCFKIGW